ncbi:Dual specificity protein phosphatase [Entamoeba marina]
MNPNMLSQMKQQLKPCKTTITSVNGNVSVFEKDTLIQTKTTTGYVIDTTPDTIPSKIIDYIYLGSQDSVTDLAYLKELKIQNILCVAPMIQPLFPNEFNYKIVEIFDLPQFDLRPHISSCLKFLNECVVKKENVIVHCNAGVSRSATVVIAYLMKYQAMTYKSAFSYVKEKRKCIQPNQGFQWYLEYTFEREECHTN